MLSGDFNYQNNGLGNKKDEQDCTPLMWAAMRGQLEVVRQLLSVPNLDVNLKSKYGHTALMWAAMNEHEDIVMELLAISSLELNERDEYGYTAIKSAVKSGNLNIFNQLIAKYYLHVDEDLFFFAMQMARVNLESKYIDMALKIAIRIAPFLSYDVDDSVTKDVIKELLSIIRKTNFDLKCFIRDSLQCSMDFMEFMFEIIDDGQIEILQQLNCKLISFEDIPTMFYNRYAPYFLFDAIESKMLEPSERLEIIKMLLLMPGVDINRSIGIGDSLWGCTALGLAVKRNQEDVVRLLLATRNIILSVYIDKNSKNLASFNLVKTARLLKAKIIDCKEKLNRNPNQKSFIDSVTTLFGGGNSASVDLELKAAEFAWDILLNPEKVITKFEYDHYFDLLAKGELGLICKQSTLIKDKLVNYEKMKNDLTSNERVFDSYSNVSI